MNPLGILLFLVILITPVLLIGLDIFFFVRKKENSVFEMTAFFIGSVYMALAYLFWELPGYEDPVNLFDSAHMHEPFNSENLIAIALPMAFGFVCYLVLKYARKILPPLAEVILLGGNYIGCAFCFVWIFQLLCGADPIGSAPAGGDYFVIVCLCIVPAIFIIHTGELMIRLMREQAQKQESLHYENQTLQSLNLWFIKGTNLFLMGFVAMLPLLGILMMILCLFGQQPDSMILAFTKTSDWILSTEISPPPVEFDTHYLCTVSLRGHRKLVRPIRYGIRKGERIVVNRQLCVANAFEQLLMEKTPRLHKAIRNFYDTYGYPISRHINHAWSADLVYLIMKPLEWVFLAVLYLLDQKPEDRICSQYLPVQKYREEQDG